MGSGFPLGAPLKTEETTKYERYYRKNAKKVKFFDNFFYILFLSFHILTCLAIFPAKCHHKRFANSVAMSETSYGRSLPVDRCFQHHQKGRQLFSKMQTSHLTLYKDSFFNPFSCIKDIKCHNSRKKVNFITKRAIATL